MTMLNYPPPGRRPGFNDHPRRAGAIMLVLGVLGLVFGTLSTFVYLSTSANDFTQMPQFQQLNEQNPNLNLSPQTFKDMAIVIGCLIMLVSSTLLILGPMVRRSSRGAVVAALVISLLATAFFALAELASIISILISPLMVINALLAAVPLSLFAMLTLRLLKMLRTLPAGMISATPTHYFQQPAPGMPPYGVGQPQAYGQPYPFHQPFAPPAPPASMLGYPTMPPPPPPAKAAD